MAVGPAVGQAVVHQARGQNGVIGRAQLMAAGLTPAAIRAMVKRGVVTRLCRSVYAIADPTLLPLAREAAALLSLGEAVLSHRSAAALWGIAQADTRTIDVTLIGRRTRPRPGLRLHEVARLHPADIRTRHNVRLTSPARTLIDLAAQATGEDLDQAFGEARAKRLLTDAALRSALARAPKNHPGAAAIRRRLADDPGRTYTRSKAEALMRRLMAAAQLPQPMVNARLNGYLVDFLWPDARLILEVDGFGTHGDRRAFEDDRRRDQVHVAAGYTVLRVTWRQLRDEPMAVVARIAQALARRAA